MPRRTSDADRKSARAVSARVVMITLDSHAAGAVERARRDLVRDMPGLVLDFHVASHWDTDPDSLAACKADIARADVIFVSMLFMEPHVQAILPDLEARRDSCDALVGCVSAGEIIKLTRMGGFTMANADKGPMALLKRLRGSPKKGASSGSGQMAMLRRLPRILKFVPGSAQDLRAYFLTMQYWLAGSEANLANLVRYLLDRYADGDRRSLRGALGPKPPVEYPDVGLYHPRVEGGITTDLACLPGPNRKGGTKGTIGLLLMRSYVLSGDTGHFDGVIAAFEAQGMRVIPAFASGLDARPAVDRYFRDDGRTTIDAMVSLTGFSLVGGPAYNDADAAGKILTELDVTYVVAQPLEFQSLESWRHDGRGLSPVETTMMVAIPEIDGAVAPTVFGGRSAEASDSHPRAMRADGERAEALAARVEKMVRLRTKAKADRTVAIVLFNFPPNGGATGTAAHLSVFESLHNTMKGLAADGYDVTVPETADALREAILGGNSAKFGTDANVLASIAANDHVRAEPHLQEIEAQWGPAPGRHLTDGRSLFILGERFGNVVVAVQPGFGYEGDPMRLLFESGFAPTHAFSAFYRWLRTELDADAVLHFGTHGALEFMPGKQAGMTGACWPERLIGDLPNLYLYAANNPSEGTIAKRRAGATLISYLTPVLAKAGLYKGLIDLKASIERWRGLPPEAEEERARLVPQIQAQAAELDLVPASPECPAPIRGAAADPWLEIEATLIPHGLHVVGAPPTADQRADLLQSMAEAQESVAGDDSLDRQAIDAVVNGMPPKKAAALGGKRASRERVARLADIARLDTLIAEDHETPAVLRALDGRYVEPAPSGDLVRNPEILPTGRNIHGFDPFRIPSAFAIADGTRQAERLVARHLEDGNPLPETIAMVLWGSDNLKSEGGPIAQALALIGAKPRFDGYGRLSGATLIPLEELGRPRIDAVMTLSGIFRDLLPLQTKLLAEAAYLAATAEEPEDQNFVRKHALAYAVAHDCDIEKAALRVFGNADGAYGSNVNHLIDSGAWAEEDDLAEAYTKRKCFAYGRDGRPSREAGLLSSALADVDLAYQNLESVELGVTTLDHYFDTLGGIGRAVKRETGAQIPVYIGDQTRGEGVVRTLDEQVSLEVRTRMLNPKWYESMLAHGYEGVRQIEAHVTNTLGWSATTGAVEPWVYQKISQTFVLDDEMRERLAAHNPKASMKMASRLLEAHERNYWTPDESVLEALRRAGDDLEDRLEGVGDTAGVAA